MRTLRRITVKLDTPTEEGTADVAEYAASYAAASAMLRVTTDPADLLCFRRDFDRLVKLARYHN